MQTDFLQYIFRRRINNLLTQNLGFFDTMEPKSLPFLRHDPRGLVCGIKSALASASSRPSTSSSIILPACF